MTSKEIRDSFKTFFANKGHKIVPSAPMVIKDDPTLMFTNAGMNQFKDIILGTRPANAPRVADSQKCLRVSGKHNDLEEVGHDTYHHTMFEMLGNWSFGDYFKKEAINWAWEYLVDVLGINPDRLYATVFEGYEPDGLSRDDEAAQIWETHLPKNHIINGNRHDNFWEMGDTGPCGPCSEIHIDLRSDEEREQISGADLVNKDHPQVIEIWNLVFMQFDRKADGSLHPLPAKVIDTGMGFERLCMAMQGKRSNYDTDVFTPLLTKISELSGKNYGQDEKVDVAMRVVADHVRTIAFSIADSQLPSNAKAGYVIRRILRRAVRYAYTFLNSRSPFMTLLIPTLVEQMGEAYPELKAQQNLIQKVVEEEEIAFLRTLDKGIKLLDDFCAKLKAENKNELSGHDAFILYDTYGFPLDLTQLILRENNMTLDENGFNKEMEQQRSRARGAAAAQSSDWTILIEDAPEQKFIGYDNNEVSTHIARYRKVVQKKREFYQIILTQTPFYGEMGGQVGDTGTLTDKNGNVLKITNTIRENGLTIHIADNLPLDPTQEFTASIDVERRAAIQANHTATHLLHHALRTVLGSHVEQKGSYVSPDALRFDFSHFQKVTPEEIHKVEHLVNAWIRKMIPLDEHRNIPIKEAKEMGAMALFGEKYGDNVRVIKYGDSIELCGGTHVQNTGAIGMLRIINESSIAAGIRRIEAVTAEAVENILDNTQRTISEVANLLGGATDIRSAVIKAINENSELKGKVEKFMAERTASIAEDTIKNGKEQNGYRLLYLRGPFMPEIVKNIAFKVREQLSEPFAFLAATNGNGKPSLTVMLSDDLVAEGLNAGKMVREAAKHIKGGGGGQPFFAQAGGKDVDGLTIAFEEMMSKLPQ